MKILCATDLRARGDAAVERASQLQVARNARLSVVHVVPPISAEDGTLEQRLLSASRRLAKSMRTVEPGVELVVRCGRPAKVVSEEAQSAHLVVIGAHEPGGFTDVLRATFRERLVSESRSPILVVRSPARGPYGRILLALDGSHATRNVIAAAESLLVDPESELAVVHAHEAPYEAMMNSVGVGNLSVARYASASMTQAAEMIQAELQQHSRDARRYRVMIADARPGVAIREAVREMKPEVLVVGTRGHGRLRRAVLGSTAHEVLEKSECDVLLVPDAGGRA